ncbi:MAG: RAD52 family DNA repair protein [Gammaproteobacteria bacterium]|nr:RAD52 family DNA repair protein [Gammaproteobacteria bacterium]
MSLFSEQQIVELNTDLDAKHVTKRAKGKVNLSYVEGWHVIAEANRIFGFGEWDRETLDLEMLGDPTENARGNAVVSYMARCRITVRGEGGAVVREGCGFGNGFAKDAGEAHESAIKEAETDAMKRALMTFGWPFGLALYDKTQEHVANLKYKPQPPAGSFNADANEDFPSQELSPVGEDGVVDWDGWDKYMRQLVSEAPNKGILTALWKDNAAHLHLYEKSFKTSYEALKSQFSMRKEML